MTRSRVLLWWGMALFLLALALNEWTLLGPTPQPGDAPLRWLLRAVDALLVGWGAVTIAGRRRPIVAKVNVALFTLLVVGSILGEFGLRLGTAIEGSPLRHPKHFADYHGDDDYWKLFIRWIGRWVPTPERVHAQLGWSQGPVTADSPLGLWPPNHQRLVKDGRRKILFYGDSFVAGMADPGFTIPEVMTREIDWADVIDVGVGGYGTDQMLLLMRATLPLVESPIVVIGILTEDLDRAILSVRTGRKPKLVVREDGELEVTGVPIDRDQTSFYASAPLAMRSLLAGFLVTKARRLSKTFDPRRPEKERLNRAILDQMVAGTRGRRLQVVFVLFYPSWALVTEDWRARFLKRELELRQLPFLDTKPLLLDHCSQAGVAIPGLYDAEGGHHNTLANRAIGEALVRLIRDLGFR